MRRLAVVAVAALVLGGLTACPAEPASSGASGTVVGRERGESRHGKDLFWVTVDADGGPKDKGRVSREVYHSCTVGKRWPACKKEAKR